MNTLDNQVVELQEKIAKYDVDRSKLMEKVHKINLEQQQAMTQLYEIYLNSFKKQAFSSGSGILVPTSVKMQLNNE